MAAFWKPNRDTNSSSQHNDVKKIQHLMDNLNHQDCIDSEEKKYITPKPSEKPHEYWEA